MTRNNKCTQVLSMVKFLNIKAGSTNMYHSIKCFSPNDAQLDSLKSNFKFALNLTLKAPTCFGVKNTILREHNI